MQRVLKLIRYCKFQLVMTKEFSCLNSYVHFLLMFLKEFFIRHVDGSPVNSEAERQRVIQCLEAAIERRVSEVLLNVPSFVSFSIHSFYDKTY